MNTKFKNLVNMFRILPGVGPRQAARFVIALLDKPEADLQELGKAIQNLKKEISFCPVCFNISDPVQSNSANPRFAEGFGEASRHSEKGQTLGRASNGHCAVCLDTKRDQGKLLVVEKVTDLDSIEKTGLYKGLYHVLGGAINPLDGLTPEALHLGELSERANVLTVKSNIEIIIATNPNTAGETTSMYIKDMFRNKKGVVLTRLARGLSSGSHLEYVDEITLKNALDHRK